MTVRCPARYNGFEQCDLQKGHLGIHLHATSVQWADSAICGQCDDLRKSIKTMAEECRRLIASSSSLRGTLQRKGDLIESLQGLLAEAKGVAERASFDLVKMSAEVTEATKLAEAETIRADKLARQLEAAKKHGDECSAALERAHARIKQLEGPQEDYLCT